MKDNITYCLSGLLTSLGVKHTPKKLNRSILTHPFCYSLEGITNTLDEYRVQNVAFRATTPQLQQMNYPVIVHINESNGIFALLHAMDDGKVTISTERGKTKSYPLEDFAKLWSGITVMAEATEQSGEPTSLSNPTNSIPPQAFWGMAVALLLLIMIAGWQAHSLLLITMLTIKLAGLGVVTLLATHELGVENSLTDKLCTLTKSTGCNEVLKSKASSLFGVVKLADVGLAYFTSTTTALVIAAIAGFATNMLQLLGWLSVLSLPFIAFSVTYQLMVVKKWCPFCMGVAATLATEAAITLTTGSISFSMPAMPCIALVVFCLLAASLAWIAVKPLLKETNRLENFEFFYTRLKRNPNVIKGILADGDFTEIPALEDELVLGNPNAPFTITEVVNPYCKPCARSFEKLKSLLDERSDSVRVQLRFLVTDSKENQPYLVAAHLLALSQKLSAKELLDATANWFSTTDYERWTAQYPVAVTDKELNGVELQNNWAKGLGINATPTIYVNGYKWTLDMDLYDLKYSL